jgi:hypothetical protein
VERGCSSTNTGISGSSRRRAVVRPRSIALEIVQRCGNIASVTAIVDDLAAKYNAPREVILRDVNNVLQDFADKRVMSL